MSNKKNHKQTTDNDKYDDSETVPPPDYDQVETSPGLDVYGDMDSQGQRTTRSGRAYRLCTRHRPAWLPANTPCWAGRG